MNKIYLIGIGMGNIKTLTMEGQQAIHESQLLIGAERMVNSFPDFQGKKHYAIAPEQILAHISENFDCENIAVLFSGDIGFYSGAKKLNEGIEDKRRVKADWQKVAVEMIPGISSLQYFCAKLKRSWEDAKIVSLHGRQANVAGSVLNNEKTFFLTGGDSSPQDICRILVENDLGEVRVSVGERLSYPEERIITGAAVALAKESFHALSVVLVENDRVLKPPFTTHGLEDDCFLRGQVPMTKSEVRSVSLSKLQLQPDHVVYDIGAGSGGCAIDIAFQVHEGMVYAIEMREEAVHLIMSNREQLGAWNLKVVLGMAPQAMIDLPTPDRAFIGGSCGNLKEIIGLLVVKNPRIRLVINAITLETLTEALEALKTFAFERVDVVQVSAARAKEVGAYHMMTGQNPIFIISGEKC